MSHIGFLTSPEPSPRKWCIRNHRTPLPVKPPSSVLCAECLRLTDRHVENLLDRIQARTDEQLSRGLSIEAKPKRRAPGTRTAEDKKKYYREYARKKRMASSTGVSQHSRETQRSGISVEEFLRQKRGERSRDIEEHAQKRSGWGL